MAKKRTSLNPGRIIESRQLTSIGKVLNTSAALLITIIGLRIIAQDLIAPVLLALFYTVLMYPIFRWFRNKGIKSGTALLLMIFTFFVVIFILRSFFTWSFGLINESLDTYVAAFNTALTQVGQSLNLGAQADSFTQGITPAAVSGFFSGNFNRLSGFIYYFVFIPILSFMILLQIDGIPKNVYQKLLKENPGLKRFKKFAESITVYAGNRLKINLVTGLFFSICLILIGIDYPIVWGLLTVILSFIPYVGIVFAGIPPVILAISTGTPSSVLLVIASLILVDVFAENIYDPYIQGKTNKISMATVVIALLFWTWLLGFIGAIMAVPLTVLLKTILADYPETRWIAALMEGNYEAPATTSGKPNRVTTFLGRILPQPKKNS